MSEVGLVMKVGQNLGLHCATQNLSLQSTSTAEGRDSSVRARNHTEGIYVAYCGFRYCFCKKTRDTNGEALHVTCQT
jgi:hypothetical protein